MRDGSVGGRKEWLEISAGQRRPEGITGAAAARVPARYDATSVRDVRSAQRPGGSKKKDRDRQPYGCRGLPGTAGMSRMKEGVRADVPLRPRGCRENPPGQGQRMQQGSRTQAARAAYEYGNQKQAYEAGAVPKRKGNAAFTI